MYYWSLAWSILSITLLACAAAAAAKSLQSCPTLCDPIDSSPPGSTILRILQARTLEWVAISFSNAWKWKVKVKSLQSCPTLWDPMDCNTCPSPTAKVAQTHVHQVGDAIQPSHPLSSPSPPASWQQTLSFWSLVLLPFLNPASTSRSSRFVYYWSLAWKNLTITLLACEMSATVWSFEHFLALPFSGIGMKTDLFQSCGHWWVFPNLLSYWVQHFHSIIFQDLK